MPYAWHLVTQTSKAWQDWLSPALVPHPDYSKLSIALQNTVENAGEVASEVRIRIRQRSQELGWEKRFLPVILDHFRTTSHDETLFNAGQLYRLQYRGDKETHNFLMLGWRSSPT